MLNRFLRSTTIGRRKARRVVLIHGLFSSNGYWVPYLRYFEDCQVTLFNIDYAGFVESGAPFSALCADIDKLIVGPSAHLIGHSFGACIGAGLRGDFLSRSFVCPTFAALAFDDQRFCGEIATLDITEVARIRPVVDAALQHKSHCAEYLRYRLDDELYVPRDDPFFEYLENAGNVPVHAFNGGHFDVCEAIAMIAKKRLR